MKQKIYLEKRLVEKYNILVKRIALIINNKNLINSK